MPSPFSSLWITMLPLILVFASLTSAQPSPDVALDLTEAEVKWSWIGVKAPFLAHCPAPLASAPWEVRSLFPPASNNPPGLGKFCLYRFNGPGSVTNLTAITSLKTSGQLIALSADRMVVHGVGVEEMNTQTIGVDLTTGLLPHLSALFDAQTGRVELPIHPDVMPAHLSIIDTSPTSGMNPESIPETSRHGQTLAQFAHHLLCNDEEECAARITSRLALGYKSFHQDRLVAPDNIRGGLYGTISDLAVAIWQEVQLRTDTPGTAVLNLSVAWDPIYGGLEPSVDKMPADVQAVYQALKGATCTGAVVIAAAGNLVDEIESTTGSLLPAAWTSRSDPHGDFCSEAGHFSPQLLYSAGGVQADGQPLVNARQGSASVYAAYGDHAVVSDPNKATETLTGSSVAALVTSATAAAVAYYRPDLSPHELMLKIYDSGHMLPRQADTCSAPPCPDVSYLSLCEAVAEACPDNSHGHCPATPLFCQPRLLAPLAVDPTLFTAFQSHNNPHLKVITGDFHPTPPTQACGSHQPSTLESEILLHPCPHREFLGLGRRPWSHPQPSEDPCPNCTLFPDSGDLFVQFDPAFSSTVSDPTLVLCPGGSNSQAYSLGAGPVAANSLLAVNIPPVPASQCGTAMLTFTVFDGNTASSSITPVLVAQP